MFANRFTIFADACVLAAPLKRNLLLSLAAADFFRIRWSAEVLRETQEAIQQMLSHRDVVDAAAQANRAVSAMRVAFEDAEVTGWERLATSLTLPDPDDLHVLAAALKTRASIIVTDNLRDFPVAELAPLDIEAKSADVFIADTIDLDPARAVAAMRRMRERFRKPKLEASQLLLKMEAQGLVETVDALREHIESL